MAEFTKPQFRDPITRRVTVLPRSPHELAEDQEIRQRSVNAGVPSGLRGRAKRSPFGRAVRRGMKHAQIAGKAVVAQGAAALGADEFAEEQIAENKAIERETEDLRAEGDVQTLEGIDNLRDLGAWLEGIAGEQAVNIGATAVAGLGGALVAGPAGGIAAAYATAGGLESGSSFQDLATDPVARQDFTLRELAGVSAGVGAVNAAFEIMPIINIAKRFGLGGAVKTAIKGNLVKRFGKGLAEQAALEGGTEAIQTVVSRTAANFANENREIFGEEGWSEIMNAAAAGAVVGGGLGGLVGAISKEKSDPARDTRELDTTFGDLLARGARSSDIDQLLLEQQAPQLAPPEPTTLPAPLRDIAASFDEADVRQELPSASQALEALRTIGDMEGVDEATMRLAVRATEALRNTHGARIASLIMTNNFVDAGYTRSDAKAMVDGLMTEAPRAEESFLNEQLNKKSERLAVTREDEEGGGVLDIQPSKKEDADLPDVLFVNEKISYLLRTSKGQLGYAPVNPNFADVDSTDQIVENLEANERNSTFRTVPLGDAITQAAKAEGVPADVKGTGRDLVRELLQDAAIEKAGQVGDKATKPAGPHVPDQEKIAAFERKLNKIEFQLEDIAEREQEVFELSDEDAERQQALTDEYNTISEALERENTGSVSTQLDDVEEPIDTDPTEPVDTSLIDHLENPREYLNQFRAIERVLVPSDQEGLTLTNADLEGGFRPSPIEMGGRLNILPGNRESSGRPVPSVLRKRKKLERDADFFVTRTTTKRERSEETATLPIKKGNPEKIAAINEAMQDLVHEKEALEYERDIEGGLDPDDGARLLELNELLLDMGQQIKVLTDERETTGVAEPQSEIVTKTGQVVVDGERLTRTMLRKINAGQEVKTSSIDEVGRAFTAGLLALAEREDFVVNLESIPDDVVVFTNPDKRPITFGEIKRTEVGRDLAQYAALETEQIKLIRKLADAEEKLTIDMSPQAKRDTRLFIERAERRLYEIPHQLYRVEKSRQQTEAIRARATAKTGTALDKLERIKEQMMRLRKRLKYDAQEGTSAPALTGKERKTVSTQVARLEERLEAAGNNRPVVLTGKERRSIHAALSDLHRQVKKASKDEAQALKGMIKALETRIKAATEPTATAQSNSTLSDAEKMIVQEEIDVLSRSLKQREITTNLSKAEKDEIRAALAGLKIEFGETVRNIGKILNDAAESGTNIEAVLSAHADRVWNETEGRWVAKSILSPLLVDSEAFRNAAMLERDNTEPVFAIPKGGKASAGTSETKHASKLIDDRAVILDLIGIIKRTPTMSLADMRAMVRTALTTARFIRPGGKVSDQLGTKDEEEILHYLQSTSTRLRNETIETMRLEAREVRDDIAQSKDDARSDRPEIRKTPRTKKLKARNKKLRGLVTRWAAKLKLGKVRFIGTTDEALAFLEESDKPNNQRLIDGLVDGSLSGFADEDANVVYVNPRMNGVVAVEVLAHEIGHLVFRHKVHDTNVEVQEQILDQFHAWREEVQRGPRTKADIRASKKGFATSLYDMLHGRNDQEREDMTREEIDYLLDFEEWFADQVSRHLSSEVITEQTVVDSFFKEIALAIEELWGMVKGLGIENYKAASTVREFLENLIHDKEGEYAISNRLTEETLKDAGIDEPAMAAGAMMALDPYSEGTFEALRAQLNDPDLLTPEERGMLLNIFYATPMRRKIRAMLTTSPMHQQLIDADPTAAAAIGMQMWLAGALDVKPDRKPNVQATYDQLMSTFGLVQGHDQAIQLMEALRDGVIRNRKIGGEPWVLVRHLRGNFVQKTAASLVTVFEHANTFIGPHLWAADKWMSDTGITALIQMARLFHARIGTERVGETFFAARASKTGAFSNRWSKIRREFGSEEDVQAVLSHLRNPKSTIPPRLRPHVEKTRTFLREMREYYTEAGLDIGDRGPTYFPLVFNMQMMQENSDTFKAFLLRPVFKKSLDRIASGIQLNEQKQLQAEHDKDLDLTEAEKEAALQAIPLPSHQEIVDRIYANIVANEGNADVNINLERTGNTPFMAAMNRRSLQFIFDEGTATDLKDFEQFQSDRLDLTMFTYIRQGVRRAEYVRRFGTQSQILEGLIAEAKRQGATKDQIKNVERYIAAMTGTLGVDSNAGLRKLFGRGAPPQGEVINPSFQKMMSFIMVTQNLAVLSLATFTSLVDPLGILVRTQDWQATGAAFAAGAKEIRQTVENLYETEPERRTALRELAEDMGIIEDHTSNEALEWEYGSAYITGKAKAVNEFFFRAIGLTQLTRLTRIMALAGGKVFIKKHINTLKKTRPPKSDKFGQKRWDMSARFMDQLNLKVEDVVFDEEGEIHILNHTDRTTDATDTPDMAIKRREERDRDDRVRAALNRMVDESILRPNAAQRPIWASDPHWQLVFHLKSFMYAFHDRILARVESEMGEGNYMPLLYLMAFIPGMIAADWLRDLFLYWGNGNPRKKSWGMNDYIDNSAQRSGLTGLYQMLIDIGKDQQYGGIGYESFAGPTYDAVTQMPDMYFGNDQQQWKAFTRQIPAGNVIRVWGNNVFEN